MNQEEKTLDECCSFEHKWKIARGHISKSIRRTRLKFSPRESTTTITLCAKFNRNLRCRVLFRDFFGRSVVECPFCRALILPTGPDPSCGALKPDKKSTSARGPSGSRRPGFGLWGKRYVGPRWLAFGGHGPNAPPPPGTATAMESNSKRACSPAHLHISAKNDIVCRL